jgi:hypothetical protein
MAQLTLDPRSIDDMHVLTRLITRELHEDTSLAEKICPLSQINRRKVRVAIRDFNPAGLGQFKAVNANTPVRAGGATVTTTYMELVDLEEKEVLKADDLLALGSLEGRVAQEAARNVIRIGQELAMRNRNLTRWMRWKAFADELTITYADGTAVDVDYDLDNSDGGMDRSHIITLSGSDCWDQPSTATPVSQVQDWVDYIADDLGVDGHWLHMNKKTFRKLQVIDEIEGYLLDHYGPLKIPTAQAMQEIFDIQGGIVIENGYWEDTTGTNPARPSQSLLPAFPHRPG